MNAIKNECEAVVAIFVAAIDIDNELTDFETRKISETLVYCKKFRNIDLNEILTKIFYLKKQYEIVEFIRMSAKFISNDFARTFYAMLCDILCSDGKTNETDIQLMALIAGELGLPEEEYLPIAKTFMARYAWNTNLE